MPTTARPQPTTPKKRPNYKIDRYLKGWKVFVDTCSLMCEGADAFFRDAIPRFQQAGQEILCPLRCLEEINRHLQSKETEKRHKAKQAKHLVDTLKVAGILDVRAEESDNFADNVFQRVFIQHRIKHRLLLITQDRGLATDLMLMNGSLAVTQAHPIHVLKIQPDGTLNILRSKIDDHWMTLPKQNGTPDGQVAHPKVYRKDPPARHPKPAPRSAQSTQAQGAPRTQPKPQAQPQLQQTPPVVDTTQDAFAPLAGSPFISVGGSFTVYSTPQPQPQPQSVAASAPAPRPQATESAGQDKPVRREAPKRQPAKEQRPNSMQRPGAVKRRPAPSVTDRREKHRFALPTTVTTLVDAQINVAEMPSEGSVVRDEQGQTYMLVKELGSGGEGIVYETGTDLVAKIYRRDKNTTLKMEKIRRITAHPLQYQGICAPVKMLFTLSDEFVGYLMPRAQGHDLLRCLLVRPLLEKRFAGWTKADLVRLCITILMKIQYLHNRNVILGDINLSNIKVVSPTEVYLVDCDSYQIEDLPCPVGQINFTAPEIQDSKFAEILRTKGNEYFAVATMLFMILVPGKTPYAHQGGQGGADNIKEALFPYPYEDRGTGMVPPGVWGFVWSHMTYEIKKSFGHTFDMRGDHYDEASRLTVDDWLERLRHYHKLLTNGMLLRQDEMSNDIFPTRLKKNVESRMYTCRLCSQDFDEKSGREGICNHCLKYRGTVYACEQCGAEIVMSNFDRYVLKKPLKPLCAACFEEKRRARQEAIDRRNAIVYTANCTNCGAAIQLTQGECDFYDQKGWTYPKRCKACRENPQRVQSQYRSSSSASTGDGFLTGLIKGLFGLK